VISKWLGHAKIGLISDTYGHPIGSVGQDGVEPTTFRLPVTTPSSQGVNQFGQCADDLGASCFPNLPQGTEEHDYHGEQEQRRDT